MILALHVHTNYSKCAESVIEDIYHYCIENNIKAIAICDHNQINGAKHLAKIATDLKVIIGEEINTKQGEIIGLFLKEKIKPKQNIHDTIEQIKSQGGLVYLPHPFDIIRPFHMLPYTLMSIIKKVDIVETFNSKMILQINNIQAQIFAKTNHKTGAVGSDAHFVKAIGCGLMEIEDFDGPNDFLEKLKTAKIIKAIKTGISSTGWSRFKKLFQKEIRVKSRKLTKKK